MHPAIVLLLLLPFASLTAAEAPPEWSAAILRDEIAPRFTFDPSGGPAGNGALVISSDAQAGRIGRWQRTFPVEGGVTYAFSALRHVHNADGRRAAVVRIHWQDAQGKPVMRDEPSTASYQSGKKPRAEPEYPEDGAEKQPGWTEVRGTYRAPAAATRALVELEFRWAANARVEWAEVKLAPAPAPATRIVRLAAVHFVPREARTPEARRQAFAPLIADAARQKADFVVLPEVVTFGGGTNYAAVAEPVPGPSTEYFGRQCLMARRLVERGVRMVQIYSGGGNFGESWDAHWDLKENHGQHCQETDKPIAGLLADLKSRGLLDQTLPPSSGACRFRSECPGAITIRTGLRCGWQVAGQRAAPSSARPMSTGWKPWRSRIRSTICMQRFCT
ncbi:MAG: (R)-stereoselective amidase [Verrucomicrobiota bacterium]